MVRQIARPAVLSVAVLWAAVAAPLGAVAIEPSPNEPAELSPYVPGELLVTFTEQAATAIEEAQAAGQLPGTGLASLDELFARYGVTGIEPVFTGLRDPETIRSKFPERSRRVPPGVELPDLSRTYRLTFNPEHDVLDVLLEVLVQPAVEEAQPNYLATIQGAEAPVP